MYVIVRYGDDKTLICNPYCAVINFINNIKCKSGYLHSSLDLCDETGLIRDLDLHKMEYAHRHLTTHCTYVLVEKEDSPNPLKSTDVCDSQSRRFIPLLERYEELLPNFRLRCKEEVEPKRAPVAKISSPAGKFIKKKRSRYKNSDTESPRK